MFLYQLEILEPLPERCYSTPIPPAPRSVAEVPTQPRPRRPLRIYYDRSPDGKNISLAYLVIAVCLAILFMIAADPAFGVKVDNCLQPTSTALRTALR